MVKNDGQVCPQPKDPQRNQEIFTFYKLTLKDFCLIVAALRFTFEGKKKDFVEKNMFLCLKIRNRKFCLYIKLSLLCFLNSFLVNFSDFVLKFVLFLLSTSPDESVGHQSPFVNREKT